MKSVEVVRRTKPCGCACGYKVSGPGAYLPGHSPRARKPAPRCACGCGEFVALRKSLYRKGHRPVDRDPQEFWTRTEETASGCRVWTGRVDDKGYGVVSWEGKTWGAHRLAWTLTFGTVSDGQWVLHHCDNPPCVNASGGCLYLGDHEQNVADKVDRGRQVDGERHGRAKLTAEEVEEIRRRYIFPSCEGAHDSNARTLAKEFGVDRKQIQRLARGEAWKRP